jgi:hypothetical protein
MEDSTGLTVAELSALSGEPIEEIRHWAELGLLPGKEGSLPRSYLHRTRLIRFVTDRGVTAEEIAEISAEQELLAWFERVKGGKTLSNSAQQGLWRSGCYPAECFSSSFSCCGASLPASGRVVTSRLKTSFSAISSRSPFEPIPLPA